MGAAMAEQPFHFNGRINGCQKRGGEAIKNGQGLGKNDEDGFYRKNQDTIPGTSQDLRCELVLCCDGEEGTDMDITVLKSLELEQSGAGEKGSSVKLSGHVSCLAIGSFLMVFIVTFLQYAVDI